MDSEFSDGVFKDAKRIDGIPYASRYNHFEEEVEMESFLKEIATTDLGRCLRGLYYDSKACVCFIETVEGITAEDPEGILLQKIAESHISQFLLFGIIGHCPPEDDELEGNSLDHQTGTVPLSPDDLQHDFGTRLQEERLRLGLEVHELAHLAGIPDIKQKRFENGHSVIPIDYLQAIAARSDVDVMYVIIGKRTCS